MEPTSTPGGQMLKLTMTILDGQYAGRKLFDRLNLVNANPTAVEIAFKTLSSICRATGVMQCANSQQLHGIPMKVKVKLKPAERVVDQNTGAVKEYDASNDVRGYDTINSDHTTDAAIVPGVAGAPGGTPPWAAGAPAVAAPPAATAPAPAYQPPATMAAPTAAQPWAQPGVAAAPPAAAPAAPWAAAAAAAPAPPVAAPPAPAAAPPPPQVAVPAGPVMLPAATTSYEEYRKAGWSDEALIQNGLMAAPAAPGVPSNVPAAAGPASSTPPWARG
jgi:hypothetical protein